MLRRSVSPEPERVIDPDASQPAAGVDASGTGATPVDLSAMPIAGLTRGRLLVLAGLFAAAWLVFAFARQVGAAGDLTDRANDLRAGNAALANRVSELQAELALAQRPEYVALEARRHRLGGPREIAFTLDPGAPPLPDNAPGSASTALGARSSSKAPFEAWMRLLFGPDG